MYGYCMLFACCSVYKSWLAVCFTVCCYLTDLMCYLLCSCLYLLCLAPLVKDKSFPSPICLFQFSLWKHTCNLSIIQAMLVIIAVLCSFSWYFLSGLYRMCQSIIIWYISSLCLSCCFLVLQYVSISILTFLFCWYINIFFSSLSPCNDYKAFACFCVLCF